MTSGEGPGDASVLGRLGRALSEIYRLDGQLGEGGMATVYAAHDLRHDRDVAIKLLHPDLGAALGGERFLGEIRTTARLQHPHILPLLDSGDAGGLLYYVMPLVTGETLRARIERERQLPIGEAVRIAREIAGALDYAHRQGVIHRDIKPENILLHDGQALVADFGIALAVQGAGADRMTQTGLSLGTPQYMSPEQAMGERTIDARSDVYALGAVVYEMLAGEAPFSGSSVQSIVARIRSERPTPLQTLRDTVPDHVAGAVEQALEKIPADRFASARAFADALGDHANATPTARTRTAPSPMPAPRAPANRAAMALGVVALVAIAAAVWGWLRPMPAPSDRATRVAVAFPASQEVRPQFFGFTLSLSPDGTRLAYVGPGPSIGTVQAWTRPLDSLDASPVAGTTGAVGVEYSPDGQHLLVVMGDRRGAIVNVAGGQVVSLPGFREGSWGPDSHIYSPQDQSIVRRAIGGALETVFTGDGSYVPRSVTVLPRGKGALFVRQRPGTTENVDLEIVAVSFATKTLSIVGPGVHGRVLPSGLLLYGSADGTAFVAPFDEAASKVIGPAVPLARVATGATTGILYPQISVSNDGTMAYLAGTLQRQRLAWLDRTGRLIRRLAIEGNLWGISLSPDGSRVAFTVRADDRASDMTGLGSGDVWVEELGSGARTRLTSQFFNPRPSWSPDGQDVLYDRVGGGGGLFERRADASAPERHVLSQKEFGRTIGDGHWLPDHRTLVVRTFQQNGNGDIYSMVPGSGEAARPLAVTPAGEFSPVPSPDGGLVAYTSDESGSRELYVQRFPMGERLAVSKGAASPGRWSRDGRALYYWNERGTLVVASIQARPALAVTGSREIAADIAPMATGRADFLFDVAPDGRVLVAEDVRGSFDVVLVRNWMAAFRAGAAGSR